MSGNWTVFAKTAATWDPSYRMQLTDEEWFDNIDANRAIRRFEYEPLTGNVVNTWKPEQNAAGTTYTHVVYDERQLFPANETNELGHFREFKWEYGTGTMLETDGPNVRGCIAGQPGCHDVDADYPLKEQNKIRIDGLGRMIERYESFSGDGYVYRLHKVETNEYIETVAAGGPSIIHRQLLDIDVPTGWKQDRTDFDGFGRVIRQIVYVQGSAPADQITVYLYNADSTVSHVAVPDPTANSSATVTYVYTYDSLGRAKSIRRPDGTPQSGVDITYDGVTQTTTEVAGAGGGKIASTTTINDRFGRLSQVWEKTDESWAITHYGYDAHDLVTSVTDPQSHQTTMTHDFAGRRTSITRAGRTWSLEYDRNGNVIAESVPGAPSGLESLWINSTVYDDLDRPTSKLIGTRDLDCQSDPAFCNSLEVFTYDIDTNMKGRLRTWHAYAQSQSWNVAMNLRVDIQGRPSDTILYAQLPGLPQLSRWIYESWFASGPRQQVRHGDVMGPLFDTWTQTFLDPRGLPSWVNIYNHSDSQPTTTRTVAEQTRNVAGLVTKRRTNVTSGMGFAESNWAYDKLGRVVAQAVKKGPGSQTVASQSLAYHGADDPKQLVHCVAGSSCAYFVYNYDLRHQLTDVSVSSPLGFTGAYRYGAAGRFTSARVSQPSPTPPVGTEVKSRYVDYVYGDADPERVTALKNYGSGVRYATFTYDEAGNMISKCMGATFTPTCTGENFTYLYDGKDQLRRATRRTGGTITGSEEYWYDKDGQRIAVLKKNGSGAATELVLFLKDTEAHYNIAGNTPTLAHIFSHVGMGTPVARVKRTSDAVVATELQFHGLANNTIATVDINGTTNATFRYAPFGEIIEGVDIHGAAAHRRRFNDKQQDELTGLVYYGVRYYDKTLIGWTQSDPAYRLDPDGGWVTPRSALLYAAHRNNPLRYLDPDGRSTFANVVKVFVGAATAVEVGTFGVAVGLAAVTLIPVVAGNHTGVSTPVTHEESYDRAQLRRAAEAEERIDRANANQVLAENINDKDQNTESSATTGRATNTQQDAASPPPDPSGEPPRRRLSAKEIRAQNQATTAANKRTNKHTNVGAKDNQNQVNNPTAQELSDKAESIRGAHDENHPGKTEQRMREQLIIEGQQRGDD